MAGNRCRLRRRSGRGRSPRRSSSPRTRSTPRRPPRSSPPSGSSEGAGEAWVARAREVYRGLGEAAADRLGVPAPGRGDVPLPRRGVAPRRTGPGRLPRGRRRPRAPRLSRSELRALPRAREGLLHVGAARGRPARRRGPRLAPRPVASAPGAIVPRPSGGEQADGVRDGARGGGGAGGSGRRPPRRRRQRREPRPPLPAPRLGRLRGRGGVLGPRGARSARRGAVRRSSSST